MRILPASSLQLLIGIMLALAASLIAWRMHWLSRGGALAAFILGAVVFGLGGLSWAALLLTFFFTSSLFSKSFKKRKQNSEKFYSKDSKRDAGQVFANGGLAGLFVVVHVFFPDSWLPWMGFAAAFAAANADTWATELGIFSRKAPVLVTNGTPVEMGTSGAISPVGTLAALTGSGLIALAAWLVWPEDLPAANLEQMIILVVAGLAGSLVDSWLGASVQAIYYCPTCQKETEKYPLHNCGTATTPLRGWRWMDNDWVNLCCTASGAALAMGVIWLIHLL